MQDTSHCCWGHLRCIYESTLIRTNLLDTARARHLWLIHICFISHHADRTFLRGPIRSLTHLVATTSTPSVSVCNRAGLQHCPETFLYFLQLQALDMQYHIVEPPRAAPSAGPRSNSEGCPVWAAQPGFCGPTGTDALTC